MKHVNDFTQFVEENYSVNEGIVKSVKKFFTGHEDSATKTAAEKKILEDIEVNVKKLVVSKVIKPEQEEQYKKKLVDQAKENSWKGKIVVRKDPAGKVFVVYDDGMTGLQKLGKAAAQAGNNSHV